MHAIKEADNHTITYKEAQTAMKKVIDEVGYTKDLTNRPLFDFACFLGGTLIHTDKGLVPIEQIKVGDMVLSKDESGEGEQVYKPVVKTMQTENVPVVKLVLDIEIQGNTFRERRNYQKRIIAENNGQIPYQDLYVTNNHPFWVEGKGWVAAELLTGQEVLVDKAGNKFTLAYPGYDGAVRANIYKTVNEHIGFLPNYGLENSQDGTYIDLRTATELSMDASHETNLTKLYEQDPDWEQDLRDQLGIADDEPADFFGFKTGSWVNPKDINWTSDEGIATATVYNFEVADTHTYYVGEQGIWVHNANCDQNCQSKQ